jgi:large subunit ribosomal protein L24
MGPLAPRRDVGIPVTRNDTGNPATNELAWGSISTSRLKLGSRYTRAELEASAEWAGGLENLCLAPGDRVVVLEGPYKGRIAPISKLNKDTAGVELESVGTVSCLLPTVISCPRTAGFGNAMV